MLKKVILTTVLGVSAFSVMAANAAVSGAYVTGQLGYANTHMGSKLGEDSLHDKDLILEKKLSNNGLAGRLAIGYQFNPNFAVEMGYLQLGGKKVNLIETEDEHKEIFGTVKLNQRAIDLLGKSIVPITNNLIVYGKLGIAYLTTNLIAKQDHVTASTPIPDIAEHKWAPEVAVGMSYDITPNVFVDTSLTHIQPLGKNRPGNIDFMAVGLGYNFG